MELIQTQAGQIEFFGARVVRRRLGVLHLGRQRVVRIFRHGRVGKDDLAVPVKQTTGQGLVLERCGHLDRLAPRRVRINRDFPIRKDGHAVFKQFHGAALQDARGMEPKQNLVLLLQPLEVHGTVDRDMLHAADPLHREPVLLHATRLIGVDPTVVRLVVTPAPHHEFKVRSVRVREHGVPDARLGKISPEKEFLSHRDVTVGDMRRAGVLLVVVTGNPVVFRIHRKDGTRLSGEVLPPGKIDQAIRIVGELGALGRDP
ncbi:MAG: hypothetical protein BWY06_02727 [Candidatus Latescibacteria bacterium ADurb.Bin168]|nr:MAG: hypothetical protein BWY06_02727 [Candidatus Latescibacteria bacterium ADurb.Bin168]